MDVQAAILAAIADRPADDTPRLAYADWLDDHAGDLPDPGAARVRAEFIRVQCEVKRLEHLPNALLQGFADLYRRQDHLLTHHRRDLLGPLADALGPHDAVFDRGFVTEIGLSDVDFLAHAGAIAALQPPPDVAVTISGPDSKIFGSPHLGVLTRARWRSLQSDEVYGSWEAPTGRSTWTRLRVLILSGCGVYDPAFQTLVGQDVFPALTDLDVSWNAITDEGVQALIGSPLWPHLRVLVLAGNPITDNGADRLLNASPTALQYLNVSRTVITAHGQNRLLKRKGWKVDLF